MSSVLILTPSTRAISWSKARDFLGLTKPRIGVMVMLTVALAGLIASWGQPAPLPLLAAMFGTGLVAASASVMNQYLERDSDARMPRTWNRALPTGRLKGPETIVFAAILLLGGAGLLIAGTNLWTLGLSLATWVLYVGVYTPIKRHTAWNTVLGAIPGAMPVLIGWSAVSGQLDLGAGSLFTLLFLWQFPHFMAIAWKYRHDYALGGLRMSTVVDPTGERAGVQAVLGALAMLPVSMMFVLFGPPSTAYVLGAFVLGICYLAFAIDFALRRSDASARRLLRLSLIHLPAILILICGIPWMP